MKKWIKENMWWLWVPIIIVVGLSYFSYCLYSDAVNDEELTIEGKIISVEYLGRSDYYMHGDTMKLFFDDGQSYVVEVYENTDFTVNSKFIIRLFKDEPDENWVIEKMYKVPDGD